jgi:hypothetical protein
VREKIRRVESSGVRNEKAYLAVELKKFVDVLVRGTLYAKSKDFENKTRWLERG